MARLFSHQGLVAVRRLAAGPSLLAFDLDGTLAPLVARPADTEVSPSTAASLQALSGLWTVAVITGRTVEDAKTRLGFSPRYLFGNHGAEPSKGTGSEVPLRNLETCRNQLRRNASELRERRIDLEDKKLSLALHYRHAADPQTARLWLDSLVPALGTGIIASHGHSVLNITPADAPDKGDALIEIMRDCGATRVLIIGDDVNDESAFAKAPPGSVSVRIGPAETPTRARFRLSFQSQVDILLSILLILRR